MRKCQVVVRRSDESTRASCRSRSRSRSSSSVRYVECQKNHAAGVGGYAVDGCREFMASGEDDALTCAACGCHRNFHRRELHPEVVCDSC